MKVNVADLSTILKNVTGVIDDRSSVASTEVSASVSIAAGCKQVYPGTEISLTRIEHAAGDRRSTAEAICQLTSAQQQSAAAAVSGRNCVTAKQCK
jgi:hypothetical protein